MKSRVLIGKNNSVTTLKNPGVPLRKHLMTAPFKSKSKRKVKSKKKWIA